MKPLFIIPLVLMSLVSFPSWGETMDDLWEMNGIYHKKHTEVPFTGEIEGKSKVDGVFSSGKFENGKMEGFWFGYYDNGQLNFRGKFKNGKKEGSWEDYNYDGSVWYPGTGTFKNGVKVSD